MTYIRSYQEILDQIDTIDPVAYAKTRNHMAGAVTYLSPYISRGIITLPCIRERILVRHTLKESEKLLQELAWREYFQRVWWDQGDAIFSDLRFVRSDWRHHDLVTAIVEADTGIVALDEGIKKLYETGYAHNHLRLWLAALSTNLAGAHWHTMGRWMYYHLVDGDLASNFLSWQWVAGTSISKRYAVSQSLINAWSPRALQQQHTWLSGDRDQLDYTHLPTHMREHHPDTLAMLYPDVSPVVTTAGSVVRLYTPWTLDPTWRQAEAARDILVIDPAVFDRYPVSEAVLEFIIRQGETVLPTLEVHVGSYESIPGIADAAAVYARAHPTNHAWPLQLDEPAWLHPHVTGYYKSFFAYYQAVTHS